MFERSQQLIDDIDDEINILLASLNNRTTWTQRCKGELENLKTVLQKKKYKSFLGHPNRYHLSSIGESCLYDVPIDRRGELKNFRGMRVRIVCVSSGRYTRLLMAGVTDETPKNLQVKRVAREYAFPDHSLHDVVYKSPRYLVIRNPALNPLPLQTKRGEPINLDGIDYVLFDGTLRQPIAVLRDANNKAICARLIGYSVDELTYESLHNAIRSLIKESIQRPWIFS
jgi:hypothetical protein